MRIRAISGGPRPALTLSALAAAAVTATVVLTDAHADIPSVPPPNLPCPILLPSAPGTRAPEAPPRPLIPLLSPRPTPIPGVNASAYVPPTPGVTFNGTPLIGVPGGLPGLPGGARPSNALPEPPTCY